MTLSIPLVRLVDDDADYRRSQKLFFSMLGYEVADYGDPEGFVAAETGGRPGEILLDLRMPSMTGLEVQAALKAKGVTLPVIFLTGHGDVQTAVYALKDGAFDFIEKHADPMTTKAALEKALQKSREDYLARLERDKYDGVFAGLTQREREVFLWAAAGESNKAIAQRLGIGVETVKMHRANAFAKTGVASALEAHVWLTRRNDLTRGLGGEG